MLDFCARQIRWDRLRPVRPQLFKGVNHEELHRTYQLGVAMSDLGYLFWKSLKLYFAPVTIVYRIGQNTIAKLSKRWRKN
jgi:hypothetical protein